MLLHPQYVTGVSNLLVGGDKKIEGVTHLGREPSARRTRCRRAFCTHPPTTELTARSILYPPTQRRT
eukprot:6064824-Pyramimonas_sp.AAC.1